ncbi:hypothetical protein D3C78_1630130 [compost metagenome]
MPHRNPCIWHQRVDRFCHLIDSLNAVIEIIDLSAARKLALDRFAHQRRTIFHNIGLHRKAVFRRRLDNGQIPHAKHGHMKRSRNRGCRQRQYIDVVFQLFQLFLVGYAKTLLFVDDKQT